MREQNLKKREKVNMWNKFDAEVSRFTCIHIEVKKVERLNISKAMQQAMNMQETRNTYSST